MELNVDNLLNAYRDALLRANKTLNLVSRQGVNKILPSLISESLAPLGWEGTKLESPLLDVGSGGGLPGIPLKIAKPELNITLLDANRKKTLFLRNVVEKLQLKDVGVVWGRFEDFSSLSENSRRFGTVTARGVGQLDQLIKSSARLLKPGGELIIWSGESGVEDSLSSGYLPPVFLEVSPGLKLIRWVREA